MNILIALILGIVAYFVAHLVFNHPISLLVGIVVALAYYFGFDRNPRR